MWKLNVKVCDSVILHMAGSSIVTKITWFGNWKCTLAQAKQCGNVCSYGSDRNSCVTDNVTGVSNCCACARVCNSEPAWKSLTFTPGICSVIKWKTYIMRRSSRRPWHSIRYCHVNNSLTLCEMSSPATLTLRGLLLRPHSRFICSHNK